MTMSKDDLIDLISKLPSRTSMIKELYAQGLTAAMIGEHIGVSYSSIIYMSKADDSKTSDNNFIDLLTLYISNGLLEGTK